MTDFIIKVCPECFNKGHLNKIKLEFDRYRLICNVCKWQSQIFDTQGEVDIKSLKIQQEDWM